MPKLQPCQNSSRGSLRGDLGQLARQQPRLEKLWLPVKRRSSWDFAEKALGFARNPAWLCMEENPQRPVLALARRSSRLLREEGSDCESQLEAQPSARVS
ncbi:hypothetical protein ACE6H2_006065 [Prunus campanulata]